MMWDLLVAVGALAALIVYVVGAVVTFKVLDASTRPMWSWHVGGIVPAWAAGGTWVWWAAGTTSGRGAEFPLALLTLICVPGLISVSAAAEDCPSIPGVLFWPVAAPLSWVLGNAVARAAHLVDALTDRLVHAASARPVPPQPSAAVSLDPQDALAAVAEGEARALADRAHQ